MSAQEKIIDYYEHSDEIEKWLALKGETKYLRFAKLLTKNNIPVRWVTLKDTYRYDKRLLVNIFKYLSFFEEFLRAQIWNISKSSYQRVEDCLLREVIEEVITIKDKISYNEFSIDALVQNKGLVNYLRNRVAHNKIILESKKSGANINNIIIAFKNCLPESYQQNFATAINNCVFGLNVPDELKITLS